MFDFDVFLTNKGRIGRGTWWIGFIIILVFLFIIRTGGTLIGQASGGSGAQMSSIVSSISIGVMIIVFISYALSFGALMTRSAKRLHDLDYSAWFLLIMLIPFFGWFVLFIALALIKGTQGPNKFGGDPRETNVEQANIQEIF